MTIVHKIYILILTLITILVTIALTYKGLSYYQLGIEYRFDDPSYNLLKPSGLYGHGYGIIGSACMILGVVLYILRKRLRSWSRIGILKHWLEFHIFLCTVGPIMVLFHTSFKFGGLVAISFWSMVAVFASGVIGRFIYIQIPRSIEGRELSMSEVGDLKSNIGIILRESYKLDDESYNIVVDATKRKAAIYQTNAFSRYFRKIAENQKSIRNVKAILKKNNLAKPDYRKILKMVKHDISLNRRIDRLVTMQNLFKYWHVAHLPFALVMLIIMIIHVAVTIVFGYRWIF